MTDMLYNLDQLVTFKYSLEYSESKIYVVDTYVKKNWFGKVKDTWVGVKDTWYSWRGDIIPIDRFLEKNNEYVVRDNIVYLKPYIRLWFSNKEFVERYFDTELECQNMVSTIKNIVRLDKV